MLTAKAAGWDQLSNGSLLKAAELASVDVLFTTDQRMRYQQNLAGRKVALVVLTGTTKWSRVRLHMTRIAEAIIGAERGSYSEVFIPFD